MTAVYLKNRNPTRALDKTPEEEWLGSKPTIDHLRPFGCIAYAHVPVQKCSKLDSKTVEGIFVGYCVKSKAYRIFDPKKREVNVTRDVIFDERCLSPLIATYDSTTDDASPNKDRISEPDQPDSNTSQIEKGSTPASERPVDLSAGDADYQHPNDKSPSEWENSNDENANVVQGALCEISKAAERIQKST